MATYTSQPDETSGIDTMLKSENPTTNYGTGTSLDGGAVPALVWTHSSCIKFDFSTIPSNATISSAILTLYKYDGSTTNKIYVYRLLKNWTEAGATWNTYDGSNAWNISGARGSGTDYNSTLIGGNSVLGANGSKNITLTASAIQEMINGTMANYGFLINGENAGGGDPETIIYFASSAHATSSYRPKLVIEYTAPPSDILTPMWFF